MKLLAVRGREASLREDVGKGFELFARLELRLHAKARQRVAQEGLLHGQPHGHEFAYALQPEFVSAGHCRVAGHGHAKTFVLDVRYDELAGPTERGEGVADFLRVRGRKPIGGRADEDAFHPAVACGRVQFDDNVEYILAGAERRQRRLPALIGQRLTKVEFEHHGPWRGRLIARCSYEQRQHDDGRHNDEHHQSHQNAGDGNQELLHRRLPTR